MIPFRKLTALNNLKKAFPDKSSEWYNRVAFDCYRSYTWSLLQFLGLPRTYSDLEFEVIGIPALDRALAQKKGVIMVTGHLGSWELLGAWLGLNGYEVAAVAQRQRDPGSNRFFNEIRRDLKLHQIKQKAGSQAMTEVLKQNKILALLSDQDARKRGVFVNFFNQPSSTPKGTAVFHYRTGAPLILATCVQTAPFSYQITFSEICAPADRSITRLTQLYSTALEAVIRRYPEQYFWFHRRWKTKPPQAIADIYYR